MPCVQQVEPVKEAVHALATNVNLQGDVLMTILDKSLPTASGLAGGFAEPAMPSPGEVHSMPPHEIQSYRQDHLPLARLSIPS